MTSRALTPVPPMLRAGSALTASASSIAIAALNNTGNKETATTNAPAAAKAAKIGNLITKFEKITDKDFEYNPKLFKRSQSLNVREQHETVTLRKQRTLYNGANGLHSSSSSSRSDCDEEADDDERRNGRRTRRRLHRSKCDRIDESGNDDDDDDFQKKGAANESMSTAGRNARRALFKKEMHVDSTDGGGDDGWRSGKTTGSSHDRHQTASRRRGRDGKRGMKEDAERGVEVGGQKRGGLGDDGGEMNGSKHDLGANGDGAAGLACDGGRVDANDLHLSDAEMAHRQLDNMESSGLTGSEGGQSGRLGLDAGGREDLSDDENDVTSSLLFELRRNNSKNSYITTSDAVHSLEIEFRLKIAARLGLNGSTGGDNGSDRRSRDRSGEDNRVGEHNPASGEGAKDWDAKEAEQLLDEFYRRWCEANGAADGTKSLDKTTVTHLLECMRLGDADAVTRCLSDAAGGSKRQAGISLVADSGGGEGGGGGSNSNSGDSSGDGGGGDVATKSAQRKANHQADGADQGDSTCDIRADKRAQLLTAVGSAQVTGTKSKSSSHHHGKSVSQKSSSKANNNVGGDQPNTLKEKKKYKRFERLAQLDKIEDFSPTQHYNDICREHAVGTGSLFVDSEFAAGDQALFYSDTQSARIKQLLRFYDPRDKQAGRVLWKRGRDLFADTTPKCVVRFAADDNVRALEPSSYRTAFRVSDLDQGLLGDSWFISCVVALLPNQTLFSQVVPFDNSFADDAYTGAFHFRLWVHGTWRDVVIDDFLPIFPDSQLVYAHDTKRPHELWCALLEKACAKLYGSYQALHAGVITEGLFSMSGGIEEDIHLKNIRDESLTVPAAGRNGASTSPPPPPPKLLLNNEFTPLDHQMFWRVLNVAKQRTAVVTFRIEGTELKLRTGLVQGHTYILTDVLEVKANSGSDNNQMDRVVRLYNTWKNDCKWKGKWSDRSPLWSKLDSATRELTGFATKSDCDFWMSYDDLLTNFHVCRICNMQPYESLHSLLTESQWIQIRDLSIVCTQWDCRMLRGQWIKGVSAGGSGFNNKEKYLTNPHIEFSLDESDMIKDDACIVLISLIQINTRQKRIRQNAEALEEYIKFRLYKSLSSEEQNCDMVDQEIGSTGFYSRKFEVTNKFVMRAGAYVIIPSCNDEDVEGDFLLRIFVESSWINS